MGFYFDNFYNSPLVSLTSVYGNRPDTDYAFVPGSFARGLADLYSSLLEDFQIVPKEYLPDYNDTLAKNMLNQIRLSAALVEPIIEDIKFTMPPGYFSPVISAGVPDTMILNEAGTENFWKSVKLLSQHLDQVDVTEAKQDPGEWQDRVKAKFDSFNMITPGNTPATASNNPPPWGFFTDKVERYVVNSTISTGAKVILGIGGFFGLMTILGKKRR